MKNIEEKIRDVYNKIHLVECNLESAIDFNDERAISKYSKKLNKLEEKLEELKKLNKN